MLAMQKFATIFDEDMADVIGLGLMNTNKIVTLINKISLFH